MPRYIEENEIYKLLEPTGSTKVHCIQIDALPRADVAYKRETAREIFDEIEALIHKHQNSADYSFGEFVYDIAELKEKYTEE